MKRARGTGRYTYDEKFERLCLCGHSLGKHSAESPHECFVGQYGESEVCDCPKFRPVRSSRGLKQALEKIDKHESGSNPDVKDPASPASRFADLQRQGFMKFKRAKKAKKDLPIVSCIACQNWHQEGKHTAPIEVRRENLKAEEKRKQELHESGGNPTVSQQAENRKKAPKRRDYGQGIHVEYSPGNAAYFVMWHHEVLSIRPTWEAADEHARGLILNKTKDGSDECSVVSSHAAVTLKRTQSGEPPVVEHYRRMSEALSRAKIYMRENPPGEHGRITVESHERGRYQTRTFATERKNAFEWRWSEK